MDTADSDGQTDVKEHMMKTDTHVRTPPETPLSELVRWAEHEPRRIHVC